MTFAHYSRNGIWSTETVRWIVRAMNQVYDDYSLTTADRAVAFEELAHISRSSKQYGNNSERSN